MHVVKTTPDELQFFAEHHNLPIIAEIWSEIALIDSFPLFEEVTGYSIEQSRFGDIVAIHPGVSPETGYADPDIVPDLEVSKFQRRETGVWTTSWSRPSPRTNVRRRTSSTS